MEDVLKTGDTVIWRGAWGIDEPKEAKVKEITLCEAEGVKHGRLVSEVLWDKVTSGRKIIVDLDNGHWAWGFQISPR